MKKLLPLLFLLIAGCSPKHIHNQAYDATFAVYAEKGEDALAICTATAYEKISTGYRLITAGHCFVGYKEPITFSVAKEIDGPRRTVTLVKVLRQNYLDFAILEMVTTESYPTIPLALAYTGRIGDRIFSPNFSEGLEEQIAEGLIASNVMTVPGDKHLNKRVIVHLNGGPGISGAAVISERTHRIIGIVTTGLDTVGLGLEPITLFYEFERTKQLD